MNLLGDIVLLLEALFVLGRVENAVDLIVSLVALNCFWRHVPTKRFVVLVDVILVVQSDFDCQ